MSPRPRLLSPALAVALALAGLTVAQKGPVTVGSKRATEGQVIGQMVRLALENDGFKVNDRTGLGTTQITRQALLAGQIDLYTEYTGTAVNNFFKGERIAPGTSQDAARSYATVRALDRRLNGVEWLAPAPANNTFGIAVPKALADKEGLRTLADLARYLKGGGAFKIAASQEFVERPDALPSFERAYGFKLRPEQRVVIAGATTSQTESAAARGTSGANAAMAYGTDGSLAALGLVVLGDPKGAQPVFQPALTVRGAVLKRYPEIARLVNPIFRTLDDATLQQLNGRVDLNGEAPLDVARDHLKTKGLLK